MLQEKGIIVSSINTSSDYIFSQQQNINGQKRYIIVLGNDKLSATRRQFSVAHELGYIILHDGFLEIENMTREEIRNMENEAHAFAAAFLLPKNAFSNDIKLFNDIVYIGRTVEGEDELDLIKLLKNIASELSYSYDYTGEISNRNKKIRLTPQTR